MAFWIFTILAIGNIGSFLIFDGTEVDKAVSVIVANFYAVGALIVGHVGRRS